MGRRRVGGASRVQRKKKLKLSKKSSALHSSSGNSSLGKMRTTKLRLKKPGSRAQPGRQRETALASLRKQRSELLKHQAAERMVLKEHMRELQSRRQQIRKGENAKTERRELGKYIRLLQEEQKKKHQNELLAMEEAINMQNGNKASDVTPHEDEDWEDMEDDIEEVNEDELQNMFAHLTT